VGHPRPCRAAAAGGDRVPDARASGRRRPDDPDEAQPPARRAHSGRADHDLPRCRARVPLPVPDRGGGGDQGGSQVSTIATRTDGGVLFAELAAPPMTLLGPELVHDLVALLRWAEADEALKVLVFTSASRDYFISHVDLTRVAEYRAEAAALTGEASIASL